MKEERDDRSPLAVGLEWSSRITSVAFEMVVPALFGHWLDQRWGVPPVFLAIGAVLGFVVGFASLLRMTRPAKPNSKKSDE